MSFDLVGIDRKAPVTNNRDTGYRKLLKTAKER